MYFDQNRIPFPAQPFRRRSSSRALRQFPRLITPGAIIPHPFALALPHHRALPSAPPGLLAYDCFDFDRRVRLFDQTASPEHSAALMESLLDEAAEAAASDNPVKGISERFGQPVVCFSDSLVAETSVGGPQTFWWQREPVPDRSTQATHNAVASAAERMRQNRSDAHDAENAHMLLVCSALNPRAVGRGELQALVLEWISDADSETLGLHKGTSQTVIDHLPLEEISADLAATEHPSCAVCLDELAAGSDEDATALPCGHMFHRGCLVPWLKQRNTCPVCRCEVEPQRLQVVTVDVHAWRLPEVDPFRNGFTPDGSQQFVLIINIQV